MSGSSSVHDCSVLFFWSSSLCHRDSPAKTYTKRHSYLKRCAQSARPWVKAVKEVKEVKTNKTKKLKKTLVQIWHKMVPKWSQNGPKSLPRWSQDAPRKPQKTTKTRKRKKLGPKRRKPGNKVTSWDPCWTPS